MCLDDEDFASAWQEGYDADGEDRLPDGSRYDGEPVPEYDPSLDPDNF